MPNLLDSGMAAGCGSLRAMGSRDPQGKNAPLAQRLRKLRQALGYDNANLFAKEIGVTPQRYNNVENGLPLSIDVALRIVNKFPDVTLDYLYRERLGGGMGADLDRRLRRARSLPTR